VSTASKHPLGPSGRTSSVFWLSIALCALWLLLALHDFNSVRTLPELPSLREGAQPPEVTAVMAVRDDVEHVADSVERLLAQQHMRMQLVVVNDRSQDGTSLVLESLSRRFPQLRTVTVDELPPDWLGKSHALHVATARIDTRWLLFTDGDAHLSPDALARAIDAAEQNDAQHVSLLPTHRGTTFLGCACLLAFQLVIQRRVAAVNGPKQRGFVGTGAFNLVRTDAYRAIGGHLPLRLEVVDDVWLGCLLHRAGFRSRVWFAPRDFAIDWGATPRALVRVVEKNMFAVLRYRTWLALLAVTAAFVLVLGSLAAPWYAGAIGWLPAASYLATGIPGALLAHRMQWNPIAGLLVPFSRLLLPIALHRGRALWRGRSASIRPFDEVPERCERRGPLTRTASRLLSALSSRLAHYRCAALTLSPSNQRGPSSHANLSHHSRCGRLRRVPWRRSCSGRRLHRCTLDRAGPQRSLHQRRLDHVGTRVALRCGRERRVVLLHAAVVRLIDRRHLHRHQLRQHDRGVRWHRRLRWARQPHLQR